MKNTTLILLSSLCIFACTRKQFLLFDSDLQKNDQNEFVYEDQNLIINYSFNPSNNLVIHVKNKTSDFLIVDWSRSSIVYKGRLYSFSEGSISMNGTATRDIIGDFELESSGRIRLAKDIENIPPMAETSHTISFQSSDMVNLNRDMPHEVIFYSHSKVKKYSFERADSVRSFESFLFVNRQKDGEEYFNHHFWVKDVLEGIDTPVPFRKNQITLSTSTGTGEVVTALVVLPLAVILASSELEE